MTVPAEALSVLGAVVGIVLVHIIAATLLIWWADRRAQRELRELEQGDEDD